MCGIIGYVGEKRAAPVLFEGLKRLEYRGYDSAGIGTTDGRAIYIKKDVGKVEEIHNRLNLLELFGNVGIAHTRWATHGSVVDYNAHPHTSCDSKIAVVHNGIVENHLELKALLCSEGHRFKSETDSEVIPHLLEKFYQERKDIKSSVLKTVKLLKGAFSFVAMFQDEPDSLCAARNDTPLILGLGENENFVASDVLSFIPYTDKVIFLENLEVAFVSKKCIEIYTFDGKKVEKPITQVAWEASDVSRMEFAHYTIKEIHEQPMTVKMALLQDEENLQAFCKYLKHAKRIYITGCGTSFHAALEARYLLTKLARLPSEVFISSEFSHHLDFIDEGSVLLAISQSGETADVLACVREARRRGAKVLSIVNSPVSSLKRESDESLLLNCGPEIGVAATKSFTSQLMLLYFICLRLAGFEDYIMELKAMDMYMKKTIAHEDKMVELAKLLKDAQDFYFIGRGNHYPIALEGALKLKELAYVHAEGFPAGELKHGTLALIDKGTPVFVLNPEDETYVDTLSNTAEMKSRGATIIGISNKEHTLYDHFIALPRMNRLFYPIVEVVPLQLFAYYTAVEKQRNPDYPRNLAKSVTVK